MRDPIFKWRIYCTTDDRWEYVWDLTAPSTCPIDSGHSVNSDSINEMSQITKFRTLTVAGTYELSNHNFYRADATAGDIIINLPTAGDYNDNRVIIIEKIGASNTVTINADGSETIGGDASVVLTSDLEVLKIKSNGSNWTTLTVASTDGERVEEIESYIYNNNYAKGDVLVFDGLEIRALSGANGTVLKASSATDTGIEFTSTIITDDSNIAPGAGINASKIANGIVSNTEFQYLDGVTGLIQTQLNTKITASSTDTLTNKTWGDNLNMDGNKIVNLGTPTADTDAANKLYVDTVVQGLSVKDSVKAATVTTLTISTDLQVGDVVDGVTLEESDRVLVKNQTNPVQNGIYVITSGAPVRAPDYAAGENVAATFMFVEAGTVNADSGWVCSSDSPNDEVDTDDLTYVQFSGAGQIIAGDGLSKTGNTLSANLKPNGGLVIESSQIAVDLSASSITGTLTVSGGGTGATTLTSGNFLQGNGTGAVTATKVVPSGAVVGTIDTQTLTNKTIDVDANTVSNISDTNIKTGAAINAAKIADGSVSDTEFQYLDGVTSAIQTQLNTKITADSTDTLTNKIFVDNSTFFQDNADATKRFQFQASSISTSTIRTITVPDSDLTLVGTTTTQTLTNKTFGNAVNMSNNKIIYLQTPTDDLDAANKEYVDTVAAGLSFKQSVRVTTTSNISLTGVTTVDGVTLDEGDRVLVKDQTDATENGIYTLTSGDLVRSTDYLDGIASAGTFTFVEEGTFADSGFVNASDKGADIVGTDPLSFVQFSGAGQIIAGNGLSKTGNTLNVNVANGIQIVSDNVSLIGALTTKGDLLTHDDSTQIRFPVGANGQVLVADSSTGSGLRWGSTPLRMWIYEHRETATGTNAGSAVGSAIWTTRALNNEQITSGSDITLASNQLTLTAGMYFVEINSPFHRTGATRLRLRNITDSVDIEYSNNNYISDQDHSSGNVLLSTQFTVASGSKVVELQYACEKARANDGLGVACGFSGIPEIYTTIKFTKL